MNPNKALWEKGDFTRIAETMRESGEALVRLGITKGLKVLDLGCGDGTTALPAAKLGADVVGVDIARNLVEAGNKRAAAQGLTNCTVGAALCLTAWFFIADLRHPWANTFRVFYYAAKATRDEVGIYASHAPGSKSGYVYPPLFAFLCLPFLSLKLPCAIRVWLGINVALTWFALLLGEREILRRFLLTVSWRASSLPDKPCQPHSRCMTRSKASRDTWRRDRVSAICRKARPADEARVLFADY
jgi:Methyltransferase domain